MWEIDLENQLWQKFLAGDEAAFSAIYQEYFSPLYHYGFRIYQDDEFIEDCLHDFFLYLYNSRSNLSPTRSLRAYLFRSFRRTVLRKLDQHRKGMERNLAFADQLGQSDAPFEGELIAEEQNQESKRELRRHLADLPPRQKEILYLKFFDNLSYEEIAEVTQLSYQTVVNHLNKALKKLRKFYQLAESIAASLLLFMWW